jgi:hypothetical protein
MSESFFRSCVVFLLVPLLLLTSGCVRQKNEPIDVSVFQQSLEYGTQWAVISDPYATFRSGADYSAPVSGYGRRGDIQKITGHIGIWYGFEKGWLPESSMIICSNELKAKHTSESMQE